jgi:hypothetical protein
MHFNYQINSWCTGVLKCEHLRRFHAHKWRLVVVKASPLIHQQACHFPLQSDSREQLEPQSNPSTAKLQIRFLKIN